MLAVNCVFGWFLVFNTIFWNTCSTQGAIQPTRQCLTGYMTDVQNWVDRNGRLRLRNESKNAIDLSTTSNPVPLLYRNMSKFRSERRYVKYLSMAQCNLGKIPPVFKLRDSRGRWIADTLEYMSFFGNKFASVSQSGQQYSSSLNASGTLEVRIDQWYKEPVPTQLWSAGLQNIEFKRLKELDLRSCSIEVLSNNLFRGMRNLEALYIGENDIYSIDSKAFDNLPKLRHLDMSRNQGLDELSNSNNLAIETIFKKLNSLMSLDLSYTKLSQRNIYMLKGLSKTLKSLSLCEIGLSSLPRKIFEGTSLEVLDLSSNSGILSGSRTLEGLENSLRIVYAKEAGVTTINIFQNFSRLEILQLSSNEISEIPGGVMKKLRNLRILDLKKNRLKTWFEPTYSLASKLELLDLTDNGINIITDEMVQDVADLTYFAISGNFIICNCQAKDFFKMASINENLQNSSLLTAPPNQVYSRGYADYNDILVRRKIVNFQCKPELCYPMENSGKFRLFDYNPEGYSCLNVPDSRSVRFSEVAGCVRTEEIDYEDSLMRGQQKLLALIFIPCLLLPLGILYVFRRNLRYCLITIRNSAMISLINKNSALDDNTIFHYDVFVSYCNEDRGWVLDHLLPRMEAKCSISVCLHERDFQVGLSILENIVCCMDRSRSIMLVISRRFLLSQWCQFEMHLAQHRLLETRREDLTLVLLEDIPRSLRPNTLHYLMVTKTYLVWPKAEADMPLFWRRLQRSLLTHQVQHTENVSLA